MRRKEVRAEEALHAHAHMCVHRIGTDMKLKGLPKVEAEHSKDVSKNEAAKINRSPIMQSLLSHDKATGLF